jgi:hypothetical protein
MKETNVIPKFKFSKREVRQPHYFHFSLSNHHYPAIEENTPEKIREAILSLKDHPDVEKIAILTRILDPSLLMVRTSTLTATQLEELLAKTFRDMGEDPSEHIDFPADYSF